MRRNKLLEEELIRIKESVGITVSPYTSGMSSCHRTPWLSTNTT